MTSTTEPLGVLLDDAVAAVPAVAASSGEVRDGFLAAFAAGLERKRDAILAANAGDLERATNLDAVMRDRLNLGGGNFEAMVASVRAVAALPDPLGTEFDARPQPSGITVARMRVPLGLVCFIYESRPNVTADGAALCLKSGNAAILRGGSEALASNQAIAAVAHAALDAVGLPPGALGMVPVTDRAQMDTVLADERLELVIPRGGQALVDHVQRTARAPVLAHLYGNCHLYIDHAYATATAVEVVANAKCQRPSTCNALESLIVHEGIAGTFLPALAAGLGQEVELRGCSASCAILGDACAAARDADWDVEYNALVLSVKVVSGLDEAIAWINTHSSHHTDGILSTDPAAQRRFVREVDSASVMVNASTRFADGFMYGLGAETGISTGKLHARGPVGLEGLTSVKWVVRGEGSVRQ